MKRKKLRKLKRLPNWKSLLEPLRLQSIKAHKDWLDSGRPIEGDIHEEMKTKRKVYNKAVKLARTKEHEERSRRLMEEGMNNDMKLIEGIRKYRYTEKSDDLPDSIDGEFDNEKIANKIKEVYEELYNKN